MNARSRSLVLPAVALLSVACGGSNGASASHDGGAPDATTNVDGAAPAGDAAPIDDAGAPDVDGGPVVSASVSVDPAKPLGTIGPGFVGLSYEKSHLEDNYFRGDNAALVAMFQLLGPSILRVGGNSVDESVWQAFDAGLRLATPRRQRSSPPLTWTGSPPS